MPTVLVVDDDAVQRLVVDAILTRSGYTVLTSEDAREAAKILESGRRIDLVITDLHMPEIGGAQFVRTIRAIPTLRDIPIIVLTGSKGAPNDEATVMDGGADDFIKKPVEALVLLARVRAMLRRTGAPQPAASADWDQSEIKAVSRVSRQIIIPPEE
jgi:DNA-binding response OmpR family regulator